jgi:hypothetical protein
MDEYVVHVDRYPSFSELCCKYSVHHGLEGGRRVGKAKEHDLGFEETLVGYECCFPFISFLDSDVVIPPSYVELGKEGGSLNVIDQF